MNPFLERLNPRRSLAAAIGLTLIALFFAGAYLASLLVGSLARERLEAQTGALYQQYALQVSDALDEDLHDHLQWLRAMADVFADAAAGEKPDRQRALLERWKATLPELTWMLFADGTGRVVASAGRHAEGERVGEREWFREGRQHGWIGDAGPAQLTRAGVTLPAADAIPVIELAAPIRNSDTALIGVIGAQLSWDWATNLETSLTKALKSGHAVESLVVDSRGIVLIGPEALIGTNVGLPANKTRGAVGHLVRRWTNNEEYVSGYAVSDGVETFPGLGWTVWVREPTVTAFASARALEHQIFAGLTLIGLVGAVLGVAATSRLTRGLATITRSADDIRAGRASALVVPAGTDEAARIGESLRMLVDGLQRERASLEALNADLDARVAARTREVERMSEENKYAAVVRERLRMARDLHDTLAHSMMALLTEIRVLRKLIDTNPAALREELANAEMAAQDGLREARAAITALRQDAVRDIGLGASLAQLFKRFEDRKGVAVRFDSDKDADALADSRAEVLYRISEEALRNVDRHAHARHVVASARIRHREAAGDHEEAVLEISIADDGVGFDVDTPRPGHFGLRGMREQAELIGARLHVSSGPGRGTSVTIDMPL